MLPRDVMTNTYVMKQNWQVEKDDIIIVSGLKFTELVRPTISRQFEIPPFPFALSSRVCIASTIWMSKNCTKMGKVHSHKIHNASEKLVTTLGQRTLIVS